MFSEPGDSGAFALNRGGQCVGIVFGGNSFTESSYVTPVNTLFEDIKRYTGAIDVKILADNN